VLSRILILHNDALSTLFSETMFDTTLNQYPRSPMTNSTLYVDRIEASQILKTSTRTVDRYMRKYRFKTRKDGRRVLIKRADLDRIIKEHIGRFVDFNEEKIDNILNGTTPLETQDKVSNLTVKDFKVEQIKDSDSKKSEERIYRDLYQELKKELKERQERLEAATYRVGQLESQVKNMVPLLDYNKKDREVQDTYNLMEQKARQNQELVEMMERKLRTEKIAKWIYLSLVGLLIIAEPILFMLWAFN